jgi:hypothetical protein
MRAVHRLTSILRDHRLRIWGPALALTLVAVAIPIVPTWNDPGDSLDEGLLLLEPQLLLEGVVPYSDYESFYGPANTHVLAGVYAVTGPDVEAERAVGLIYRLAVAAGVFALAAPAGVAVAVAAGFVSGIFVIGPAALAWYGGLALSLWSLWALQRAAGPSEGSGWLRWAGIAAGLAIAFRPQFGVAIGLAALPLLAGRPVALTGRLVLWALVGTVPLLVHVALAGPFQVFENLVVDALFRSGPQSALPIPPLSDPAGKLLALLLGGIGALIACTAVAWRRAPGDPEARRLASIALLAIGLLPQALGRAESLHILNVACVAVALAPAAMASPLVLGNVIPDLRRLVAVGATGLAVVLLSQTWLEGVEANYLRALGTNSDPVSSSYDRRENWVTREERSFPFASVEAAAQVSEALAAVDRVSSPGDRLVVGPEDLRRTFYNQTALYHLLPELEPGTYHLTMAPGTANRPGAPLADDIAEADVVMLGTGSDWHQVTPNSELGSDDATEALEASFCLRASRYPYRVYTRCNRGS